MATPFVSLGLKTANVLIDKHFEKIPDKYMHSDAYSPKKISNPLKKNKRRDGRDQAEYPNGSRPASPSPQSDFEDRDEILTGIPRYPGASPEDFISPPGQVPHQYSTAPPKIRTEYIPPPPIGMAYPSPPPPQPNGQFPPQPTYNQFPPPPRNEYYPPSPPPSADPSRDRRRHRGREQRHRGRDGRRDRSSDDELRGRRPKNGRRSSSYEPPYVKQVTRYNSHENGDESESEDYYRSTRRPKQPTKRSSSYQPSRNQELSHDTSDDEHRSNVGWRRPTTSSDARALNPYDEEYDKYTSKAYLRPRMTTRRSSSYNGKNSDNYYPPSTRDNGGRRRRDSLGSSSKRYGGFDDSRPHTSDPKDGAQLFTKSKEGLLSGALGAVVGGWAAQRAQRSASGRNGRRSSGSGRGRGQEDDKMLTLLAAAVGGLAANAVVEHIEDIKAKKDRSEIVKRESKVYEWDDGYA